MPPGLQREAEPKAEAVQALVPLRRAGIRIMIEEEGDGPGLVDLVTDLPADMEQQVPTQILAVRQLRIVLAVVDRAAKEEVEADAVTRTEHVARQQGGPGQAEIALAGVTLGIGGEPQMRSRLQHPPVERVDARGKARGDWTGEEQFAIDGEAALPGVRVMPDRPTTDLGEQASDASPAWIRGPPRSCASASPG